ncbi:MAG: hypothetical protein HQL07_10865 [Nitrospirae bacterium]|nr:hypothetical protein [Magnetococcales bacterium]HAT50071.1 hypothetical protein [Alphaproteobacteria bacterium]
MWRSITKRAFLALIVGLSVSWGSAASAREVEKPFSDDEIRKFMADYPQIVQTIAQAPANRPWIPGVRHDKGFADQLKAKGWDSDRFFYIFDQLNQGLMIRSALKEQAAATQRMQESTKKFQEESRVHQEAAAQALSAARKEMAEAENKRQAWMKEILDTQENRIRSNPMMHPFQKQQALDAIRQQRSSLRPVAVQATSPADSVKTMQRSQIQAIIDNPFMPPAQKYWLIRQMKANTAAMARNSVGATAAPAPAPMDSSQAREHAIKQQKEWIAQQKASLANNPFIPPAQRQSMTQQMDQYVKNMEENMNQDFSSTVPLQKGEMDLVEKYGDALMKVLQQP